MKAFFKENKGILLAAAIVLLLVGGWLLLWRYVGGQVEKAAYNAAYEQLSFDGAHYAQCDLETVQLYVPEADSIGRALCGAQIGELSFPAENGVVTCPLYACKPLEEAGKRRAVVLLEREGSLLPYELAGFQYLDDSPNIWAVCASYGIGFPENFESVTLADADGNVLETVTDREALSDFYDKFLKLGEDLGEEGLAQAYYDAYTARFGESDQIRMANGTVEAVSEEAYEEAMAYWSEGLLLVTIRLDNGLQLRNCIYAPVPKVFSVYGDYAITEQFFE